jgi:hypothetical protein
MVVEGFVGAGIAEEGADVARNFMAAQQMYREFRSQDR